MTATRVLLLTLTLRAVAVLSKLRRANVFSCAIQQFVVMGCAVFNAVIGYRLVLSMDGAV
jgi:hypothetical protein